MTWAKQNMIMSASVASSARVCFGGVGRDDWFDACGSEDFGFDVDVWPDVVGDECFFVEHVVFVLVDVVLIRLG